MTKLKTFAIGGCHPDKHKTTSDRPIEDAGIPETVCIPVCQHIGRPAKILVKKGDRVKTGTLIADADDVISADVHSSVSGEVVKIEENIGKTVTDGFEKVSNNVSDYVSSEKPRIINKSLVRQPSRKMIFFQWSNRCFLFLTHSLKRLPPVIRAALSPACCR